MGSFQKYFLTTLISLLASFSHVMGSPEPQLNVEAATTAPLNCVVWKGSVFSWQREGIGCWLQDPEGNFRFELMQCRDPDIQESLQRLLSWEGTQGWTVIAVAGGGGTFSRWHEEWQELTPVLDSWMRTVAILLVPEAGAKGLVWPDGVEEITPGGRLLPQPHFSSFGSGQRVRSLQIPSFSADDSSGSESFLRLRGKLVERGLGRGGQQTVIQVTGAATEATGLRLTSSHQPGVLYLSQYRSLAAEFLPSEVFLPWWPLNNVLQLKD